MTKRTTATIAKLAARILDGGKYTRKDVLALAGSALAQAERDEGVVKAWGYELDDELTGRAWPNSYNAFIDLERGERIVPVEIRRIGKARRK